MAHPYWMYVHMQAQPAAWLDVIARNRAMIDAFARSIAKSEQVVIVGIGTSFHAAQTGEYILRAHGGAKEFRAVNAFDCALYPPRLAPGDAVVVISHRGTKGYSVESLRRAKAAGCRTALITGLSADVSAARASVDQFLLTVPQEQSSAHTFSYTGSVAVLAALAQALGRATQGEAELSDELLTMTIPQALQTALGTEGEMAELARAFVGRRRIWIVGGGPAAIVAHETALKIKETSHLQAEGLMTETMIHGPFQCVEADDVFILIAPEGAARARTMELAGMIQEIGAPYFVVSDCPPPSPRPSPGEQGREQAWIQVPRVPEPFSPLTCLMPMQLFSYHLALACGRNPDIFRRDDERFARASARIKL